MRTLFRKDDLSALLPLGDIESQALPGESYKLAFTPGLLAQVFEPRVTQPASVARPGAVLGVQAADRGGYVDLAGTAIGGRPQAGCSSRPMATTQPAELAFARQHFFLPRRTRDPFHADTPSTESIVTYDEHDLLMSKPATPSTIASPLVSACQRLTSDPTCAPTTTAFSSRGG